MFESYLHRAKGLGPSHTGVPFWIIQRVTAVALLPLSVWAVYMLISLIGEPFSQVLLWFSSAWKITLSLLFVIIMFYHGALGLQVIWEDYVPAGLLRGALILSTRFLSILFGLLSIVCLLKIYFSPILPYSCS